MAWTKLDDDAVQPNQPLSAFVGKRLTDNINSYADQLTRLETFVYPTTAAGAAKVKWASVFGRRGTVITVDVGKNANRYVFRIFYRTTNADIGGTISVRDLNGSLVVSQHVDGTATPTSVNIPYVTPPISGLRGFHVSFESDIGPGVAGSVQAVGAVANQIFCDSDGSNFPFTYGTGTYNEMYHLVRLSATNNLPSPAGDGLLEYQVCAFRHNSSGDSPPNGVLVVWPNIEVNPPILTTSTSSSGAKVFSELYELGRLELFSISVETYSQPTSQQAPLAYQQATPLNRLNNSINGSMIQLQPNAGTILNNDGFLGRVLPVGDTATFAFFVQTDQTVLTLDVSFRAVAYNQIQNAPTIVFTVRNHLGTVVGTPVTLSDVPVPRVTGQTTVEPQNGAAVFMNGVLAGSEQWGMRDAMNEDQAYVGLPVRFTWGPNTPGQIKQGTNGATDAVYTCTISATADLYIYGFNCKVV